jgi:glycosyltransferase involved in cell wall biosynthesis
LGARQLHIGLNLIFLVPGETGGMEVAARELIPALLAKAPSDVRFTGFVSRETAARSGGPWEGLLPTITVPVHARNRVQWVLGEQALLPRMAARAGVDLMHSLASTAPLRGPFFKVVTVHDLIYARFPEAHQGLRDLGMRVLVPRAARHADRVIAISESTRQDLIRLLGIDAAKIDVVPQGVGANARPGALSAEHARMRFSLGERRVLLSLSAKRPHKNLARLIGGLAMLPAEARPLLVLPGYQTWHERELREHAASAGVAEDVRFLGWLSDPELEGLWDAAAAFVFPSLYEGFGLPVLEAMARGVPVACSNVSSLPEVAGDAALFFDPYDTAQISHALRRILDDAELRERLRARGREHVEAFTWERTASLTLASYERVVSESR